MKGGVESTHLRIHIMANTEQLVFAFHFQGINLNLSYQFVLHASRRNYCDVFGRIIDFFHGFEMVQCFLLVIKIIYK